MISRAKGLRHRNSAARNSSTHNATSRRTAWGKICRFMASEDGPTTIEYGVMLMMVVAVCLLAVKLLGQNTHNSFSNSAQSINTAFTGNS